MKSDVPLCIVHFRAGFDVNGNSHSVWVWFNIDGEPYESSYQRPLNPGYPILQMTVEKFKRQVQQMQRGDYSSIGLIGSSL